MRKAVSMTKIVLLLSVLSMLSFGLSRTDGAGSAERATRLAAPVGPMTSAIVDGFIAAAGPAHRVEFACDNVVLCGDPRTHVHVLVPITLVNHSADTIDDVFDTEFRLLASDATTYRQVYCDHGWGFGNTGPSIYPGTTELKPEQRTTGTLCFSVPRGAPAAAALYWDPPFRLDSFTVTHPTTDTSEQLMPLPAAPGQRPVRLAPAGPRGAVSQFGVTLTVGVVRRDPAPQPVSLDHGLPSGLAFDVVPVRIVNRGPDTVHYRDADLVLLDARGREYAATEEDGHVPGLGGFDSALPPGAHVSADVAFIVPEGLTPIAVRWQPSDFTGEAIPPVAVDQVVLLPGAALPPPLPVARVPFVAHHNARDGYTLRAPATWRSVPPAHLIALRGADLTLEAPDGQAFVAAGVQAANGQAATAAALDSAADTLIKSISLFVSGPITHRGGQDHGMSYVVAGARIATAADLDDDVLVLLLVRGTRVYALVGAVNYRRDTATYNPRHDQEWQDLTTVFARSSVS